jgi:hypothetical protein
MMEHDTQTGSHALARRQFEAFNELGRVARLRDEDRRRLLWMSVEEWSAWAEFQGGDGAAPPQPPMPAVLLRLASASYRLAVRVDRDHAQPPPALH